MTATSGPGALCRLLSFALAFTVASTTCVVLATSAGANHLTHTWTGLQNSNLNVANNWSTLTTPHAGDNLVFPAVAANKGTMNNNLSVALGSVTFQDGGYTLSGSSPLNATSLTDSAATGTNTLGVVIAGTGGVTKSGAGTLILPSANTYSGSTNVSGGVLQVSGTSAGSGGYTVTDPGVLRFTSSSLTLPAAISGTGAVESTAGAQTLSGAVNPATVSVSGGSATFSNISSGTLNVSSGTATVNSTYSPTTVNLSGGTLAGSGAVRPTTLAWTGGTMSGTGTTTMLTGTTLTASGAATKTLSRALAINGGATATWSAGNIACGAAITNAGLLDITGAGSLTNAGGCTLTNNGTITKNGASAATIGVPATNASGKLLRVVAGQLNSSGGITNHGTVHMLGGAVLNSTSAYTQSSTGVLRFNVEGAPASLDYGRMLATGATTLGGKLSLNTDGYIPQVGDTYNLVALSGGGTITNSVATWDVLVPGGLVYDPTFSDSGLSVTVSTLPEIRASDITVDEDAATASFTLTRTGANGFNSTVNYTTVDGSATAGEDYTTQAGSVTFGPEDDTETVVVPLIDDGDTESNERFQLKLSAPKLASLADGAATSTIVDDESGSGASPSDQVWISDARVVEGDSGTVTMTFKVTRTGTGAASVSYATADKTASAGSDYVATSGTVSFTATETEKLITVTVNGDTDVEANETLLVKLSGASTGLSISDAQGVGTIAKDD